MSVVVVNRWLGTHLEIGFDYFRVAKVFMPAWGPTFSKKPTSPPKDILSGSLINFLLLDWFAFSVYV